MKKYNYINGSTTWLPLLFSLPIHHIRSISVLPIIFSEMISIFKNKLDGSILPVPSNSKIEPVFSIRVIGDICITLELNGERVVFDNSSWIDISTWKAAIDNDVVIEIDVISIGMPYCLFLLTWHSLVHKQ